MMYDVDSVLIPFDMTIVPIKRLALINFEKKPEEVYNGLELQYLDTKDEGKGYRLIAYRLDKYVDVYDEESLHIKDKEGFEVCGNGLANYKKDAFKRVCFERTDKGVYIEFELLDVKGRKIDVVIKENSKKKTRLFDLVAPIGISSINPVSLPIFAMYDFDLVRKRNTEIKVNIDGRSITLDPFPVPIPKDGQFRYFARYAYDCELVEFGKASKLVLPFCTLEGNEVKHNGLISVFEKEKEMWQLRQIKFEQSRHRFILHFKEAFPDLLRMEETMVKGSFKFEMDESMGNIAGEYTVKKEGEQVKIKLVPTEGWCVKAHMFLTKMMFMKKSVFCTWPKTYEYTQIINLATNDSECSWKRINT